MARPDRTDIEDRVFELSADHTTSEIAAELGISWREAAELMEKVFEERTTPNLVAAREALDRLTKVRFV